MKINTKTKYCQTCGIPLDIDYSILGAGRNEEYCDYCLKNEVKLYNFSKVWVFMKFLRANMQSFVSKDFIMS